MIYIQKLKQFPLSFRILEKYSDKRFGTTLAVFMDKLTNEELVSFLDEQGVFISITFYPYKKTFNFDVGCMSTNKWHCSPHFYETRDETTSNGIIKAFELLETKLKTN